MRRMIIALAGVRLQHRIARAAAPPARAPASRLAEYLWAVFPWVLVTSFAFLVVKLIAAAP